MNIAKHVFLVAEHHPSEYLIHKYWARKPHNILRYLVEEFTPEDGLVVDPFCGSGVLLAEAVAIGRQVVGYDLNPTAILLSSVTADPPSTLEFRERVLELISSMEDLLGHLYDIEWRGEKKTIRYCVHSTVVVCKGCGRVEASDSADRLGRRYLCSSCGTKLSFNLENLHGTRIVKIVLTDGETIELTPNDEEIESLFEQQQHRADNLTEDDPLLFKPYSYPFLENRRILAFKGMNVSHLFTTRAFRFCCVMADEIHSIEDVSLRNGLLLFLTSSVVQFSRLIAYRNNLTSGGPAWTVPGFWVPPKHLETNPLGHLRSRLRRFLRGIGSMQKKLGPYKSDGTIKLSSAQRGLEDLISMGAKPDLVFFDPPYGDNVPYLEFSTIWNAFLRKDVDFESEIVVSDRKEIQSRWEKYRKDLDDVLRMCGQLLAESGYLVVTFNNLEEEAWFSLISGLQSSGFACQWAWYQVPAVISSKAQFSAESSYVGDFYCIYRVDATNIKTSIELADLAVLQSIVVKVLSSREGRAPKVVVMRALLTAILRSNFPASTILQINSMLQDIVMEQENYYIANSKTVAMLNGDVPLLSNLVIETTQERLINGSYPWKELYKDIIEATEGFGIPTQAEVAQILHGLVKIKKRKCYPMPELFQPRLI